MSRSDYSIKNLLKQEPVTVAGAVKTVLGLAVIVGLHQVSGPTVAAAGIAVETVLNLFYVRRRSVSTAALAQLDDSTR